MIRLEDCSLSVLRRGLGAAALATDRLKASSWKRFVRVVRARDELRVTASTGAWALRWQRPSAGDDFELFVPGEVAERFYRESRTSVRRGDRDARMTLSRDESQGRLVWSACGIAFDLEPVEWPKVDGVFPVDVSPDPAPRSIAVGAGLLARIGRAFQRAAYPAVALIWQPTGNAHAPIFLRARAVDVSVEIVLMPMRIDAMYPEPGPLPVRAAAAPATEAP